VTELNKVLDWGLVVVVVIGAAVLGYRHAESLNGHTRLVPVRAMYKGKLRDQILWVISVLVIIVVAVILKNYYAPQAIGI
jgi:hypothetical protein